MSGKKNERENLGCSKRLHLRVSASVGWLGAVDMLSDSMYNEKKQYFPWRSWSFMEREVGKSFLNALIYIAMVDVNFDSDENDFFYEVGEELGFQNNEIEALIKEAENRKEGLEEILSGIESEDDKTSLLKLLIDLCHVDGKYSASEKAGMIEICGMLGLETKSLKKLEREYLANEGKQAFRKGFGAVKNGLSFVGKKSVAGGKIVASGISSSVGKASTKLSDAMKRAKTLREENKKLREELKKTTVSEATKQNIILRLNAKISELTSELKREKTKNKQNEEMIRLLQAQLEDLERTMVVAEAVQTA